MATRSLNQGRVFYRVRQFGHALWPRVDAGDLDRVNDVLEAPLAHLFFAMEKRDQRHAIEVMNRLRDSGATDRDLLTAALLHDCGKGGMSLWLRVLRVISPRLLTLAAGSPASTGWRGAAYRLLHDAEISARLAESAGASLVAVRLILGRVAPEEEPRLALLRAADDAS